MSGGVSIRAARTLTIRSRLDIETVSPVAASTISVSLDTAQLLQDGAQPSAWRFNSDRGRRPGPLGRLPRAALGLHLRVRRQTRPDCAGVPEVTALALANLLSQLD